MGAWVQVPVRKSTLSVTKSSSFVLIGPILNKIQPFKNYKICKEMYGFPDKCPAIHTFGTKFLRVWMAVFCKAQYCALSEYVGHPIILILRLSRYEIRQWRTRAVTFVAKALRNIAVLLVANERAGIEL